MQELIQELSKIAGNAKFASLVYKTKETKNKAGVVTDGGEVARYNLTLGANYHRTVENSLLALQLMSAAEIAEKIGMDIPLVSLAKSEVEKSLQKTLDAHAQGKQNEDYTKQNQYVPVIAGLNVNTKDGTWQLFGLLNSKVVLQEGVYKTVNSAPLTIAKNKIRKLLPIGKFREFAVDIGNSLIAKMNGETLELTPPSEIPTLTTGIVNVSIASVAAKPAVK